MIALHEIQDRVAVLSHREQVQCMTIACADLLSVWEDYATQTKIDYIESVLGTYHIVENTLPRSTLNAIDQWIETGDTEPLIPLRQAFSEPITALQDDDLFFPERPLMAYYAVYNVLRLALGEADSRQAMVCYRQVISVLFAGLEGDRLTHEMQGYANRWWHQCQQAMSKLLPSD